ncbi:hybrid sensor histidine kinase/response regulator [Fibrobacter sp. UWB13]|uniref:hybrid sensor histidine kinase/response regulator n=1 Tax=Fibrobacter sp. UWB13 TaxID=1896204 RepID=UPI000A0D7D86|nr:ATP-binding protein [Fibrobacter sp. UWB13]SMG31484.1 His Kinase A (phospho-acceptor) domain-containing protein [Fibrobacter sp. UWB13]
MDCLESSDLTHAILSSAGVGLWVIEVDEGRPPRMYADKALLQILGFPEETLPEDLYNLWCNNVDLSYYEAYAEFVEQMNRGEMSELEYAWNHQSRGVIFLQNHGKRNDEYKRGVRLEGCCTDVTEQIEFKMHLRELDQYSDIANTLGDGFDNIYYVDINDNSFIEFNAQGVVKTLDAKNCSDFFAGFEQALEKVVYREDWEAVQEFIDKEKLLRDLENDRAVSVSFRFSFDGRLVYYRLKATRTPDSENHIVVTLENVDEEESAKAERKAIANRDMAVISGLSDDFGCVVYVDYETLSEVHYRFDPMFDEMVPGWSKINNFGKRLEVLVDTVVHPSDRESFCAATEPAKVLDMVEREHMYFVNFRLQVGGEDIYYQIKFVKDENFKNHVIAGFHSVDAETKREMANLEKAELANKAKSAFLFNMSHDIRTPLNAMIGFTDMAVKNIDDKAKALDCLNKSKLSSEHLLSLINDVLDMSRIESGKVELDLNPVNLGENSEDYVPMLRSLAEKKNVHFDFAQHDIQNRYVYVDFLRLNQVVINVVSNAVKYTPSGGSVTVDISQIPSERVGYGLYQIVIKDTGIGMSAEYQQHLFDEFSRERTSTVSKQQGTGLGLAITKRIIDMMEGSIEVDSKVGEGSKFTIRIPMRIQEHPEDVEQVRFAHSEQEAVSFEGFKVLVVEDNELNLEISKDILESAGVVVESAEDGSIAVERLKEKGPDYYDCILMDIQMPVMDGFEATRTIRQMFPDKRIPIIALSANAFDEDRRKSFEAGMDGHLAKPIVIAQLEDALKKYLKK